MNLIQRLFADEIENKPTYKPITKVYALGAGTIKGPCLYETPEGRKLLEEQYRKSEQQKKELNPLRAIYHFLKNGLKS